MSRPSAGAICRASDLGSVRSAQSFSVVKETPELVFWALDRTSKPENDTTPWTSGMFFMAVMA
ncbi:hypothetical protein ABIB00_007309 [Bradyrhizobium sp. LB14.3]